MPRAIVKDSLMRKVNDLLGLESLYKLDKGLTNKQYNELNELMEQGSIRFHNDGYLGLTCDTPDGWTTEGFHRDDVKK